MRTYRVSQVLNLTPLDERFERLAGFDLPGYWAAHSARFRAGLRQGEATIRLSPDGRERARDLMSQEVNAAIDATAQPDARGWLTAVVPIEGLPHAQSSFLSLGAEVEVLAPDDLRAAIARSALGLGRLYGAGADAGAG